MNACGTGASRREGLPAPNRAARKALADSPSGNSGGVHSPPQMPRGGRRSSSTRPSASTNTKCAVRAPRRARRLASGMVWVRPAASAAQPPDSGQRVQAGFARVQTVAPRSMMAWV